MKKTIVIITILVVALTGYKAVMHFSSTHQHAEEAVRYTCPMHPQIVQDRPGDCPICGMRLVPMRKEEKAHTTGKVIRYRSTMMPEETSDRPGKDSMGMDMIPYEVEVKDGVAKEAVGIDGLASVTISPEKMRMMGVTFDTVKRRAIVREFRTSTKLTADESLLYRVSTKTSGWIEKLYVGQTGQYVSRGQPLFAVYSPELVVAQQEYLSAINAAEKVSKMPEGSLKNSMRAILESARERLSLFDLTEGQIRALETSGKYQRAVTIYSPVSGFVMEKMVVNGQKIMMNDTLMVIADLSRLWGEIDIHEADMPYVKLGMPVEISLSYWPGKVFRGRIGFIYPFLKEETRTLRARIDIPNHGIALKVNMFADAVMKYNAGVKVAVPEGAVMRSGTRDYAFVAAKNDTLVPVVVKLGLRSSDGFYEVVSGLKGGEKVVTSANFLVDSESAMKAALQSVTGAHQH